MGSVPRAKTKQGRPGILTEAGFQFDAVFTSVQKQAIYTAWTTLMESNELAVPHYQTYRLNDRHWGKLQGVTEKDLEKTYCKEQLSSWKAEAPPALEASDLQHPSNDPIYRAIPPSLRPGSESAKMVSDRVQPLLSDSLTPLLLRNKTPLVVGHQASITALCRLLEGDDEEDSAEAEEVIPTGVPVMVLLDEELDFRKKATLTEKFLNKYDGDPTTGPAHNEAPKEYNVEVKVISAKGMRDADWWAGSSDPYVVCKVDGKGTGEFRTPTMAQSRAAETVFNHVDKLKITHGDSITFTVYDEDWGKTDDFLGSCTLRFEDIIQDFSGKVKLVDENGKAMPGKKGKGAFLTIAVRDLD
ncbi:2 [Durusdinium trenchii]|uniref:2 n=1 Tax=Durusdinium trenchii TaxID=1381693 RepID=A0ABP0H913_9DINO